MNYKNLKRVVKTETDPKLNDLVISQVQDVLSENLQWLDHSFGQAQKLVKLKDRKRHKYPAIYIGKNEYVNVFPDDELGNFSFFYIKDPVTVPYFNNNTTNVLKSNFSLIFWFNIEKINNSNNRNLDSVMSEILEVFENKMNLRNGHIEINKIHKEAENIYRQFDISEIDSQYLMQPYSGLKLDGQIITKQSC